MIQKIRQYLFYPRFHFNRFQFNLVAIFLIAVGFITGSYLTLSKIFPNVFALNDTTKTWTFSTANASQFTYDSNLVTVDDTGAHPVSGVNKIINPAFATDNTSWSTAAIPPAGWVEVPGTGNGTFSDANFLVMKYEAKAWDTQTNAVIADGGYGSADGWAGNDTQTRYQARSIADGRPWVRIAQSKASEYDALEACTALGSGYHLITNNEWMTIARNAELVNSNWSGNVVGTGYLYAGHNDNYLALSLKASTNDANRAAYTDDAGTTEALTTATYVNSGQSGTRGNQVRTFNLSNTSVVWDIAGNVWEWTNNIQSVAIDTTAGWVEWNHANVASGARALYGSNSYLSASGTGQVYGGALNNGFRRGGYWGIAVSAGAFALILRLAVGATPLAFVAPVIP